ncbi:MAG: class I SAM-dependent methyltransferase [Actinomycetota bacterium]|nr:class I SAM-dependent methyltransferase [Actinomycetota bacterium]
MDERERRARSFGGVAAAYERARPEYPREAVEWLVQDARVVVDLGAGTGKLTRGVVALGHDVVAVEPSEAMAARLRAAVPEARVLVGSAEEIPLPDASADAVVAGQAYHWFDPPRALPEIARVLRPASTLGLVWNKRDVRTPWVARLTELVAGSEDWHERQPASVPASGIFGELEEALFRHEQRLDRQALLDLALSSSSVAVGDASARAEVLNRVGRLYDEVAGDDGIVLPYVTLAYRASRR